MTRRHRSRLNIKLFLTLVLILAVTGSGVFAVHRHQVARSAETAREAGFEAIEQGDLENAAAQLSYYCDFAPDDLPAAEAYAKVLIEGGHLKKKAFEIQERILLKDASKDAVRVRQIRLALDLNRPADARTHCRKQLKKQPENAELIYLLAQCDQAERQFQPAAEGYRKAIEHQPDHTLAHDKLAWLLETELDQSENADVVINHLAEQNKVDAQTQRVLAEFWFHRSEFERAELAARSAISAQADDVKLLARLAPIAEKHADSLARRGEHDSAKAVLTAWQSFIESGIKAVPDSPAFYIVLAHLQQAADQHDDAVTTLRRGQKELPANGELPFLIVQQFILTDRIEDAQAELKKFPETASGRTYRNTLSGLLAVHEKKFEKARDTLAAVVEDGLDDNPFARNVRLQLARCEGKLGSWDEAAATYEDILRRRPGDESARLGLAVALLATGEHKRGVAELKSLTHLDGVLQKFILLEAERTARQPHEIRDWDPLQTFLDKESRNVDARQAAWLRALIAVAQRDLNSASEELESHGLRSESLFDLALILFSNRDVPLDLLEAIVEFDTQDSRPASAVLAVWAQEDFSRVRMYVEAQLAGLPQRERLVRQAEVATICQTAGELIESASPEPAGKLFTAAEALFRQLADLDAEAKPVFVRFLVSRGRADEAISICEASFGGVSAEIAAAWLDAAQTHADSVTALGRLEEVLQAAVAPSLAPSPSPAFSKAELQLVLADLFAVTERNAEAETMYRRVLLEAPGHPVAQNNLAWLLAMQKRRLTEALEMIEAAISDRGLIPQLLDTRGCVQLARGEHELARVDFQMSLELEPSPDSYFHLSVALSRANEKDAAADALKSARTLGFHQDRLLTVERPLATELEALLD